MFQPRPLLVQTSASQVPSNGQRNLPVQPAFLARVETNPRLKARVTQTKVDESAGQENFDLGQLNFAQKSECSL
jgi:hypothetical protein